MLSCCDLKHGAGGRRLCRSDYRLRDLLRLRRKPHPDPAHAVSGPGTGFLISLFGSGKSV